MGRPPVKEVQFYKGMAFYLRPDGYFGSQRYGLMHRFIWADANGPIPDGWNVHHKDENKKNNNLSNLELMPRSKHTVHHWDRKLPTYRHVCKLCKKEFDSYWPSTVYCSPACKNRDHYWSKNPPAKPRRCPRCGKMFTPAHRDRIFCSHACQEAMRLKRKN